MVLIHFLFFIALVGTVVSLCGGLILYLKGGELYNRYGNRLMQARVVFQGLTIFIFFIMLSVR